MIFSHFLMIYTSYLCIRRQIILISLHLMYWWNEIGIFIAVFRIQRVKRQFSNFSKSTLLIKRNES